MSLVTTLSRLARSPQGRRAAEKAMRYAKSPEGKRKIETLRERVARKPPR